MQQYTKAQTAALDLLRAAAYTTGQNNIYIRNEPHTCACCFTTISRTTARNLAKQGLVTITEEVTFPADGYVRVREVVALTDLGADAAL